MSGKKLFFYSIIILSAIISLSVYWYNITSPKFLKKTDTISFLTGAKIISGGKTKVLYDIELQEEYQNIIVSPDKKALLPFRNFPITAIFYIPLLQMELLHSYIFVLTVNLLLILAFHFLAVRFMPNLKKYKYLPLLTLFFYPTVSNLIVGQYTTVILLIFLSLYLLIKSKKPFWAGLVMSLLLIKPQYMLFLPFAVFLTVNKKRFFYGLLAGTIVFVLANIAIAKDINVFLKYPSFILSTETADFGSRPHQMPTIYGIVRALNAQINNKILLFGNFLFYVVCSALVFYKYRFVKNCNLIFVMGIMITLLFSVHALAHDLILLILFMYIYLSTKKNDLFLDAGLTLSFLSILSLIQVNVLALLMMGCIVKTAHTKH